MFDSKRRHFRAIEETISEEEILKSFLIATFPLGLKPNALAITIAMVLALIFVSPASSAVIPSSYGCKSLFAPTLAETSLTDRVLSSFIIRSDGSKELLHNVAYEISPEAWRRASSDPTYLLKAEELAVVVGLMSQRSPTTIVEFGPGDGSKALSIINQILAKPNTLQNYIGIDINSEVVRMTAATLAPLNQLTHSVKLEFVFPVDLESANHKPLRKIQSGDGVLGLFLGQTLGNPASRSRGNVLRNIRMTLPGGSEFISGVALVPKDRVTLNASLAGYRNSAYLDLILGPLRLLNVDHLGHVDVEWNSKDTSVEVSFTFEQPVSLSNGISFKAGERLLVFRSHRFTEAEIERLWRDSGFVDVQITHSANFPYALVSALVPD